MTNKTETNLIGNIISKYTQWQKYLKYFEEDVKKFEDKKEELSKEINENPDSPKVKENLQFMLYKYQLHLNDLRDIATELSSLYKFAHSEGLSEKIEDKQTLNNLNSLYENHPKQFFVAGDKELEERIKGSLKQRIEEFEKQLSGEQYNKMVQNLVGLLEEE